MIKKTITWGIVLTFLVASVCPAYADQSIGYQFYYNQGVEAFKDYDAQKPLRFFKIAQIYDPTDEDLNRYLSTFDQRGLSLELHPSQLPPDRTIGYKYYFNGAVKAFQAHNDKKAIFYFRIALIFNPASRETLRYLGILYRRHGLNFLPEKLLPVVPEPLISFEKEKQALEALKKKISELTFYSPPQPIVQGQPYSPIVEQPQTVTAVAQPQAYGTPAVQPQAPAAGALAQPQGYTTPAVQPQAPAAGAVAQPQSYAAPTVQPQAPAIISQPQPYPSPSGQPQQATVVPQPALYVPQEGAKQPPEILSLAQITNNGQIKPKLQIAYQSSVIITGKNIKNFLVVDEGYIGVKIIDPDHLKIDALKIGSTFLHIWDDFGRFTLYIEVIFPKSTTPSSAVPGANGVYHSRPFKVLYTNDWDTYYSGKNVPDLKRQSYQFEESLAITGDTPYGFFDTSGDYIDYDSFSQFDTYTIGLSQIPLEGTSNFDLRGFDALRYLSPLTMPGTRLRGAFADIDLLGGNLGLSVSHGQEQEPLGFLTVNESQFTDSYIDAAKLTLFPLSKSDQYSINYATAYGPDRPNYLTDHVYSLQGQHQFNDFLTLNAEQATDSSHDSTLASLKWLDGPFRSGLDFRNIDKDYSTISTLPDYQGETGAMWTTDADLKNVQASSFFEAYQDHLYPNPEDPRALNYDGNGHVHADITANSWSDSDINYMDTAGELSPTRSLGLDERVSRSFGLWNSLKGTVFGGAGYQNSHSSYLDITDFDREDVVAGIQLPLTNHVTSYTNYEYDWLNQPDVGGHTNPSVVNAGLEYQGQITPKISFNSQVDYHDELGVKDSNSAFLSGEESVIFTSGFDYTPTPDTEFFADADASKILSHVGNPSYDDFEVHLGVRITFGGATYWDPLGIVSGIVFKDRNGDGKFSSNDEGIPGVKVKVGDKEATTDRNGRYRVQIRAKAVDVTPVLDTVPGGLLFSTPQVLNVKVLQGRTIHADFGLISQTGIYGIVFVDKKGSGVPSEGDQFIGKVKVILDGKNIQRSDSHGTFYFRNVTPGQHVISIDINTLAINMIPSIKLENKIDVAEGTNYMFNIPIKVEKADTQEN